TIAPRARSESPPAEISVQLFDLLADLRPAPARRERPDLQADVGGPLRRRAAAALPNGAVARGPPRDRGNPAGHEDRPAFVLPGGDPIETRQAGQTFSHGTMK